MKKLEMVYMLAAIVCFFSVVANAQTDGTSNGFIISINGNTKISKSSQHAELLDLGSLGDYKVWYTGSAGISPTIQDAKLAGNFSGKIWKYEYSADNVDLENAVTKWTTIDTLVSTFTTKGICYGTSITENRLPTTITARWLKISYDCTLIGKKTTASGNGSITAAAVVPEPSAILAAISVLTPAGFIFRRKRK